MKELELICGDPGKKAATYSRFIIPFAYKLRAVKSEKAKPYSYQEKTDDLPGLDWRKRYFTCETEKVLFERARWFELETKEDAFLAGLEFLNEKISAVVSIPQLVLFEFPKDEKSVAVDKKEWDILQVGFLILEVYFKQDASNKPTLDGLIKINELFRYFGKPFDTHFGDKQLSQFLNKEALKKLRLGGEGKNDEDTFYKRWGQLIDNMPIGDKWMIECAHTSNLDNKENPKNTYPDNRAFVWTCAILPDGATHLWRAFPFADWKASRYGHWIKLLNVDPPGATPEETHKSREFEREWADKHTYHRWEEMGTYYGFTSHSGAVIAPEHKELPIWQHFGQMYFDQVLLLLYVRVVLFRFSAKLGEISREARDNHNDAKREWAKAFQKLRWEFALFTNLYQFPLLSNQQQGIELYTLARECMEVDELFKEVQEEIHSSHDYLSQQRNQEQTKITTTLTWLAAIVSVIGLTIALFSMSVFVESPWIQWCMTITGKFKTFALFLTVFLLLVIVCLFLRKRRT